jgi:aerobic carbon-monoxide dehydrogenase medium subunit
MITHQFIYSAPRNLDAAIKMLRENKNSWLLAGGQGLLTDLKRERLSADLLVDLQLIPDLRGIHLNEEGLQIGSFTTLTQLTASEEVTKHYPALAEAAADAGDLQTRNQSTLGGYLASNDPAGDLVAAVLVQEGVIQVYGPDGHRSIPASEFSLGPFKTALAPAEVITGLSLPVKAGEVVSAYEKFKNPANSYAICGIAARIVRSKGEYDYKLAVTGALEYPSLLLKLQSALANKAPTDENITAAINQIELPSAPRQDLFASGDYRINLVKVLAKRAILRAAAPWGPIRATGPTYPEPSNIEGTIIIRRN